MKAEILYKIYRCNTGIILPKGKIPVWTSVIDRYYKESRLSSGSGKLLFSIMCDAGALLFDPKDWKNLTDSQKHRFENMAKFLDK